MEETNVKTLRQNVFDDANFEMTMRGVAIGASLLLAAVLASTRPGTRAGWLGAVFTLGTACYLVTSSPALHDSLAVFHLPIHALSIAAPVIFWWFALALFDDEFRWRPLHFVPLALIAPVTIAYFISQPGGDLWRFSFYPHRLAMVFVYGHAIWTALRTARDDLLEGRRRFRAVFAVVVAIVGLIITYVEAFYGIDGSIETPATALLLFQASAIFGLTLLFGAWLLETRRGLLHSPAPASTGAPPAAIAGPVKAADRPAYETLTRLLDEGVWREEGLTVAGLAEKVGLPEHQLRALINGQLGYRNFSAFLNARRIEAAKAMLADPAQARRQILQIALDVGFGSIAPFNRAFKEATGKTPTEFRKAALGD